MHKSTIRYALVCALAVLLLGGCAYGNHIKEGDAYFEQGQYEKALQEYKSAQKIDPDKVEAVDKIEQTLHHLAVHHTARADEALEEDELFSAIDATSRAYEFRPQSGRVSRLIERVSARVDQDAQDARAQQYWAYTLALYEAASTQIPPKRTIFGQKAAQTRAGWSEKLQTDAQEAEADDLRGLAALYWAKSQQLSHDPTARQRSQKMRQQIGQRYIYRGHLEGDASSPGYQVVAATLSRARPHSALVVQTRKLDMDAKIHAYIRVSVSAPSFETTQSTRAESVTYQSGTRMVRNYAYDRAQDDLTYEERKLVAYQRELSNAQNALERSRNDVARQQPSDTKTYAEYQLERAQRKSDQARNTVDAQRDRVQSFREDLAVTEPFVEEAVYQDLHYTVTTHTRTATSIVAIHIEHADARPALRGEYTLERSSEDDTHRAYPEAGIAADPLNLPADHEFRATLFDDAAERVAEVVEKSFEGWRHDILKEAAQASSERERIDFYAIYVLTDPKSVDPDVVEALATLSGIPDALQILNP